MLHPISRLLEPPNVILGDSSEPSVTPSQPSCSLITGAASARVYPSLDASQSSSDSCLQFHMFTQLLQAFLHSQNTNMQPINTSSLHNMNFTGPPVADNSALWSPFKTSRFQNYSTSENRNLITHRSIGKSQSLQSGHANMIYSGLGQVATSRSTKLGTVSCKPLNSAQTALDSTQPRAYRSDDTTESQIQLKHAISASTVYNSSTSTVMQDSYVKLIQKHTNGLGYLKRSDREPFQSHSLCQGTAIPKNADCANSSALQSKSHITQCKSKGVIPKSTRLKSLLENDDRLMNNAELNEICEFARYFKLRRLTMGLTQTQVGSALNAKEGPAYSQSAICRFEKLDVTAKSARRMKPILEQWLAEAEQTRFVSRKYYDVSLVTDSPRKRKRRTCFSPQAINYLIGQLRKNPYPSKSEMVELSRKLDYDREVIRVWFCNRRQALKSESTSGSSSTSETNAQIPNELYRTHHVPTYSPL
ncbi:unnamed protein product [Calicophoron daubneyi]|uniref:POU domain protein n=1 Tax=Calicophoron daubneyi TaxID=300641 RepID=A0AAV2T242_CALDB